jgi:hypothetical protein
MKLCKKSKFIVKTIILLTLAIGFLVCFTFAKFPESRWISVMTLGYLCNRFWGKDLIPHDIPKIWA